MGTRGTGKQYKFYAHVHTLFDLNYSAKARADTGEILAWAFRTAATVMNYYVFRGIPVPVTIISEYSTLLLAGDRRLVTRERESSFTRDKFRRL